MGSPKGVVEVDPQGSKGKVQKIQWQGKLKYDISLEGINKIF